MDKVCAERNKYFSNMKIFPKIILIVFENTSENCIPNRFIIRKIFLLIIYNRRTDILTHLHIIDIVVPICLFTHRLYVVLFSRNEVNVYFKL